MQPTSAPACSAGAPGDLCNNALHIVECPLSADQEVVELDNAYEIMATVVESDMLDRWLLSFGEAVSEIHKTPITL